jgi:hypothetical protein
VQLQGQLRRGKNKPAATGTMGAAAGAAANPLTASVSSFQNMAGPGAGARPTAYGGKGDDTLQLDADPDAGGGGGTTVYPTPSARQRTSAPMAVAKLAGNARPASASNPGLAQRR